MLQPTQFPKERPIHQCICQEAGVVAEIGLVTTAKVVSYCIRVILAQQCSFYLPGKPNSQDRR